MIQVLTGHSVILYLKEEEENFNIFIVGLFHRPNTGLSLSCLAQCQLLSDISLNFYQGQASLGSGENYVYPGGNAIHISTPYSIPGHR